MARNEADREDLMQEATALAERVELWPDHRKEPIVAGFRKDGCLSVYFGSDPAYQFDPEGRLRRAFVQGKLYRTQGTTLAELTRVRSPEATDLLRHDLSPEQLRCFFLEMRNRVAALRDEAVRNPACATRQVPTDEPVLTRLAERLEGILGSPDKLAPTINRVR